MFVPNNTTNLENFWNRLSTFYDFVPRNEKEIIEVYWKHLFNALEGLRYDLAQATLAGYLNYAPGYIEEQFQEYPMIFSGEEKNVELLKYDSPIIVSGYNQVPSANNVVYNYKVTAFDIHGETPPSDAAIIISGANDLSSDNNTIVWETVSGVLGYNIYGRAQNQFKFITNTTATFFIDNGSISIFSEALEPPVSNSTIESYLYPLPNDYPYLSIPVLSGMYTGLGLREGIDYDIEKLHYIKINGNAADFTSGDYAEEQEIFNAPQALSLLPSLTNLYFEAFGELNSTEEVINTYSYTPYISGWLTGAFSYFEERKMYAIHMKHLSQALTNALAKGPSFKNLHDAFCLISGMPFSYEEGIVDNIWEDSEYTFIAITSGNTYSIPKPLELLYDEGDDVNKYAILASGINFHDYISSSGILEELTAEHPEQFWYTLGIQRSNRTYNLSHYKPWVDYFTDALVPAGLLCNYFNLPPRGYIYSPNPFYSAGATATLSGVITDPEDDVLTYFWEHIAPLTAYSGSPSLVCTMNTPTQIRTTTTLTIPPADRYYLFRLNVADSDNDPNVDIEQNVRGTYSFTTWGQTVFMIGDAELRYIYLT